MQRAGYRRKTRKVSAEDENSCVRVWSNVLVLYGTQECVARSQKVHLLSAQNGVSRLKRAAAYFLLQRYRSARQSPVKCILGSAARSLKNVSSLGLRKHSRICGQQSKMAFQG